MRKSNIIKYVFYFFCFLIGIWFLGWIVFFKDMELGAKILLISSLIIGIPIFICMIIMTVILPIYKALKRKNLLSKVAGLLYMIVCILFISGIVITFLGTPFEGKYMVEKVNVFDVRKNVIMVDDSVNNHGDEKIIEFHKPFYANIKKGDLISVRYPVNKRDKMFYVVNSDVGENLMGISFILFFVIGFINLIIFIFF